MCLFSNKFRSFGFSKKCTRYTSRTHDFPSYTGSREALSRLRRPEAQVHGHHRQHLLEEQRGVGAGRARAVSPRLREQEQQGVQGIRR